MAGRLIENPRLLQGAAQCLLAILILCAPRFAHASNNCPWINEATVSGLLDGQAIGDFNQGSAGQPATCNFVFKDSGGVRTFTITVETVQDPHARVMSMTSGCKQPREALPAIGNEAYECTTEHSKDAMTERVVGRVRDQVFSISIGTTGKADLVFSIQDLKARITLASEQVSGNLF